MEITSHSKHSPGCPCDFAEPNTEHVRMINLATQKHYNIVDMNSIDVPWEEASFHTKAYHAQLANAMFEASGVFNK